jgi:1-acyl-sn-glycerol-3-phosphate acyltransferase
MPKQTSIMAKKSLQYTPLGPFMTMSGAIFVDRGNNARAVQSLAAAGELMKRLRVSLWMFPEGTRSSSENPEMLPLKKGGFHLAIQAGIPIIPIVTENYWRLYRKGVFDEGSIKVRGMQSFPSKCQTVRGLIEILKFNCQCCPQSPRQVLPRQMFPPSQLACAIRCLKPYVKYQSCLQGGKRNPRKHHGTLLNRQPKLNPLQNRAICPLMDRNPSRNSRRWSRKRTPGLVCQSRRRSLRRACRGHQSARTEQIQKRMKE